MGNIVLYHVKTDLGKVFIVNAISELEARELVEKIGHYVTVVESVVIEEKEFLPIDLIYA